ncbi:MAG: glycoside hydrolase family 9 protein [Cytophagales bacterium]
MHNKTLVLAIAIITIFSVNSQPISFSKYITVDQFGYPSNSKKVCVIRDPQTGFDASETFTPGAVYQLRDSASGNVVFSSNITVWNSGNTDPDSGDKCWWFDFSSFTTPGSYYVHDPINNVSSYPFKISDCVYNEILKHAVRTFYYQRVGFTKQLPFAEAGWVDGASHIGPGQDTQARLYNDAGNSATQRDLRGGWYDAGDYNKYVNFTWECLIQLLLAYEENPSVWSDNYNIPESGNGIPDLLDEIKYELDWLLRMQEPNGSVLSVMGLSHASPPSSATGPSRYGPASTSATLTFAGVMALASKIYSGLSNTAMNTYANTLLTAAENAWNWADANPNVLFRNNDNSAPYFSGGLASGQQETNDYGRLARKVAAACFLYASTGKTVYRTFFESNYSSIHLIDWYFAYPFEHVEQDVLLYYTKLSGINTTVANTIKNRYRDSMTGFEHNLPALTGNRDPYRAYLRDYTWGSNSTKSKTALMIFNMITHNILPANHLTYREGAMGYINHLHGTNPFNLVYLSNMVGKGAEKSVSSFYHTWFYETSATWSKVGVSTHGPAPGFLVGGPNPSYNLDGCCPSSCGSVANNARCNMISTIPPRNQPKNKSYLDFNHSWPLNSWEVTENGIYYQAAYIKLLSKYCAETANCSNPLSINNQVIQNIPSSPKEEISIFPNPANQMINIQSKHDIIKWEVIDIQGKTVMGGESNKEIFVEHLQPSIYTLKIEDGLNVYFKKWIKN